MARRVRLDLLQNAGIGAGAAQDWAGGDGAFLVDSANMRAGVATPAAPTLGTAVAGALAGATYYVKVTYVTASGESLPSAESNQVVAINNVVTVTSPIASTGAIGYNVYVSTSTGTETKQNDIPIAIGTGWTEPVTGLIAGVSPPAASTAAGIALQMQGPNGGWVNIHHLGTNSDIAMTGNGMANFRAPAGPIRAVSNTATAVYASVVGIPQNVAG